MAVLLAAARLFLADDKPVVHGNVPAIAELFGISKISRSHSVTANRLYLENRAELPNDIN
jgi:hypothetical protein